MFPKKSLSSFVNVVYHKTNQRTLIGRRQVAKRRNDELTWLRADMQQATDSRAHYPSPHQPN
ncbi:hypothetical protein J6590_014213 [Homalodisca vitripennis]|nr:hypothetical protein J6590_014213 [Homalodisca vitripennis]